MSTTVSSTVRAVGERDYDPPRRLAPASTADPIEVELAYNVRPCGTCRFFWPADPGQQPYGPFAAYDFKDDTPPLPDPPASGGPFRWHDTPGTVPGRRDHGWVSKGADHDDRDQPKPYSLSAGKDGGVMVLPSFSSADHTDSWTKYAYYYRYRSVYQEHFDLKFVESFLLPEGSIRAAKAGLLLRSSRTSDDPSYEILVQYDGDPGPTRFTSPARSASPVT
jgi:hypothetical protein